MLAISVPAHWVLVRKAEVKYLLLPLPQASLPLMSVGSVLLRLPMGRSNRRIPGGGPGKLGDPAFLG